MENRVKGVNLIQAERFWTVSSHWFLHYVPGLWHHHCLIQLFILPLAWKIRVIMEQALSLLHFLSVLLSAALSGTLFFLTLFYPYFWSKIISPPLLLPQFNAGCFLSLPTLSLFRPPPPLPPPQSGTNSQDPVTYLMQRRSCSIDTIKLSVLVQKWCIFGYFCYNLCLIWSRV